MYGLLALMTIAVFMGGAGFFFAHHEKKAKQSIVLIKAIRKLSYLGMSDYDLAKLFGVSVPTMRRWIAGEAIPHPAIHHTILRVAKEKAKQLMSDGK